MTKKTRNTSVVEVHHLILQVRGHRVILDADLARIYGVETKRLKEQVKRNADRFPDDFAFVLTQEEVVNLRSQIATSSSWGGARYLPLVFTEHGAIMVANVLNSPKAVQMSVLVVRAFIKMREQFSATRELTRRLAEIEKNLITHDDALTDLYAKIRPLLLPPEYPPKKQIGFAVRERRARYSSRRAANRV